jgi:hypothetical protein
MLSRLNRSAAVESSQRSHWQNAGFAGMAMPSQDALSGRLWSSGLGLADCLIAPLGS